MQPPLLVPTPVAEILAPQTAVSSVPKPKVDLGKMHFKKQILSASVIEESPITSVVLQDPPPSEQQVLMESSGKIETVTPTRTLQSQNNLQNMDNDCPSENALTRVSDVKLDLSLKEPTDSSHKGKVDVNTSSITEQQDASENIQIRSRSDSTLPGSESDADSVQTSSSYKSGEPKATAKLESRSKDTKNMSSSRSKLEETEKSSNHSRSEKDERTSSYSKSDRDSKSDRELRSTSDRELRSTSDRESKHTPSRSSRSDKGRRRTKSRSRSRSRGPRTSSRSETRSRSERSRSERGSGSRSDRSYYDSERRSGGHRSSPYRERRGSSRSRTDSSRVRGDSSDSEDDHRRTRTRTSDSSRSSTHSSLQRDSKSYSSHSKSERDSEIDKITQSSKSERASKRTVDSSSLQKCSTDVEPNHRKSNTHYKPDISVRSTHSSPHALSQTSDKRLQKSSCSESEVAHKGKSQSQGSDRSSGSEGAWTSSTSKSDSKQMSASMSSVKTNRQSKDTFHSPNKIQTHETPSDAHPQSKNVKAGADPHVADTCQREDVGNMNDITSQDKGLQKTTLSLPLNCDPTDRLQEPALDLVNEKTHHCIEVQNDSAATLPNNSSGDQFCEKFALGDIDNVNKSLCSEQTKDAQRVDPQIESTEKWVDVTNSSFSCSNDRVIPSQDKTVFQGSVGSKSLPSTVSVRDHPKQNTKPENTVLCSSRNVNINMQSCKNVPLKSEPSSPEPQFPNQTEQQNSSLRKNRGKTKKSRWDIVGQDTSDSDNPQKLPSQESKPAVKKVISVKRIEFSKDVSQEDPSLKGQLKWEAELHSETIKQEIIITQEHSSAPITFGNDQSDSANLTAQRGTCETSSDRLDIKPHVSQMDGDPSLLNNTSHVDRARREQVSSQDDCGVAVKRMHSVVVVPKNSTLTHSDTTDKPASPCTPSTSPGRQQYANRASGQEGDLDRNEIPSRVSPQQRHRGFPAMRESTRQASNPCVDGSLSAHDIMVYQSQSNMVDSTSQLEGSNATDAQPSKDPYSSARERPKIGAATVSQIAAHSLENSFRQSDTGHPQHYGSGKAGGMLSPYQHGDFASSDDFNSSLGWDFTQSEQPSSTYQQPDSSYGASQQHPNTQQPGNSSLGQVYRTNNGAFWTQLPSTTQPTCRPVYLHVPATHYQEPVGQVHPDSLTNDCDEDSEGKPAGLSRLAVECNGPKLPGSLAFVQAHEISSNCRGSVNATPENISIVEPPRDKDNSRPHRGRGPPKKRRPEMESDSDSETEPVLASKRERLAERELPKVSKESREIPGQAEVQRPLLSLRDFRDASNWREMARSKKMPPYFDLIEENLYLTERSSRCLNEGYCSNRRFQMKQHADFEVILTEDKGWGLRAARDLIPNTFVLEYCGEVLDHKEFKTRVKKYASMKNIHYYFMALKNNEIIDATLKGNCSRFMNHSCEPNCETQKWTVNGQLRVGFFTSKTVTAGTELTFDYQFQRYGKEAQKCFCGAPSCRGFLGGENRVSVRAAAGKMKKERPRKKDTSVSNALTTVDEELEALLENGEGLYDEKEVVSLCRLMVRVETMEQKLICLKLIQDTQSPSCLKQFLDHHGLSLLWIFMVELSEAKGNSVNNIKLQFQIMKTLSVLPISTKNMLEESHVLSLIQRWAQTHTHSLPQPPGAEQDGYSSENTSRAQTPLNTPDGSSASVAKLGPELDSDTPKRAVYRRLKISENSLDSAMSDASKASDGKEEEEEDEEEMEDEEVSRPEPPVESSKQSKTELVVEAQTPTTEEPTEEPVTELKETPEEVVETMEITELEAESQDVKDQEEVDEKGGDEEVKEEGSEGQKESGEEEQQQASQSVEEREVVAGEQANVEIQESSHIQPVQTEVTETPSEEQPAEEKEEETTTAETGTEDTEKAPGSQEHPGQVAPEGPPEVAPGTEDATQVVAPASEAPPPPSPVVPVEPAAVGTPSQDEEEGVSDVESERSQEALLSAVDIGDMAARLLDSWKDLKEVYRIPKKSQVEKEIHGRSLSLSLSCSFSHWVCVHTCYSLTFYFQPFDLANSSKKTRSITKERTKLSTEERRKLFEQEVAQREVQKQQQQLQQHQQQQRQQQLQTLAYDAALTYTTSPAGFIHYPPGYPLQTYVDPVNPNAGKVLLPTPPVEPLVPATLVLEQTPPQALITELGMTSPSSTSQPPPVSNLSSISQHIHQPTTPLELHHGTAQQYAQQPSVAGQDPGVGVLSVPAVSAPPQVGSYTTLWDPTTQQAVTVQTQVAPQYQVVPAPPPTQTAIYYQGQPCQTIYSIPTAYPQANTPVLQAYADPAANYLHGQQVYTGHQQGVVVQQGGTVTTIVTSQTVQQMPNALLVPNSMIDLPPPSPPKPKTIVLPPSWKVARDGEGKIYYYHVITRQTQWDPPSSWDGASEDSHSLDHEAEMDLGTPTYDENPSKFSTKTAEADTSSELAKRSKETFRKEMSQFIVTCLNPFRKPDCKLGRIVNTEDFKHLARKLTHGVMNKELKSCKNPEDLECNENVKHKTKEYIKKYMQKFGNIYRPKEDTELD
uniref:[histone H3]-lysine(36) N-trimethyltransferase n=1 Tax=Salmo trutta TaxID=8032 RepID=A0A674BV90_SALTR